MPRNTEADFWKKIQVVQRGNFECWEWTGARNEKGYGMAQFDGKWRRAHRVAWALAHPRKPIPPGIQVCHRCDNEPCCNPKHLFLGTNDDNAMDRWRKWRKVHGHVTVEFAPKLRPRRNAHPESQSESAL